MVKASVNSEVTKLQGKINKVVVNSGLGRLAQTPNFEDKILPEIAGEIALITGQKPSSQKAKQSIAGFKIREGQVIGLKVTLRRRQAIDFINRLINIVLPRVRDFRGIDFKSIDKTGNLSIGLKDHLVFPEINAEVSKINFGLEITIVPFVSKKEEAVDLYKQIGIPFKKV